jgi:hypothetical protein
MYPLAQKFDEQKKSISKSNSNLPKVHNYHLVKVSQKDLTFNFMIPFFNPCLVIINNLE